MLNPLSFLKHPVLLSLYFIATSAHAQTYSSAASDSLGGAGRASVEASDVNYLNPAALVHIRGRNIYSTFNTKDLSVGLSEASDQVVIPASISYFQKKYDEFPTQEVQVQEFRMSVADFVVQRFSMGLTGNINTTKINGESYNQTNGTLGFFFTPKETMGLAAVFYNVFAPKNNVPEAYRLRPQMGFGFHTIYKEFIKLRADLLSAPDDNFGNAKYMAGFETLLNEWCALRFGYQNDILAAQELLTTGIGFAGPRFTLNYGHQGNLKGRDFDRHAIDFIISF